MKTQLKWYDSKKRKPLLRIKALRQIASEGKLSVRHAQDILTAHHHREIWESFRALESKGLISEMGFRTEEMVANTRGRMHKYYHLTEKGFLALIQEGMSSDDFWRATINFSRFRKKFDRTVIDLFCHEFLHHYLQYPSVIENSFFISQLDILGDMCEKWVQDNISENEIGVFQKILEILAIHPNLTVKRIADKTFDSLEKVRAELKRITRDTTFQEGGFLTEYDENIAINGLDYMSDFMFHNTIKKMHGTNGESIFSLSLYGVMLVIFLLRNYNAHRMIEKLFVFKKFNIQQSLDIISDNYKDQLPLIFGQWNLLKSVLGIVSVYNFDVIVDKNTRQNTLKNPVLLKGNKEFYDANQGIALYSRKQLMDFIDSGISILSKYRTELEKEDKRGLINIMEGKLTEICVILGYSVGDEMKWNAPEFQGQSQLNSISTVPMLMRAFANEITFIYYINQNRTTSYIPDLLPAPDYKFEFNIPPPIDIHAPPNTDHVRPTSPKQRLVEILTKSTKIKEWFVNRIEDCVNYNDRARETMNKLSIEISQEYK